MAAGHQIRPQAEPVARYASLEVSGKEPVIARNEHASRHRGPAFEIAARREDLRGLPRLALGPGFIDHWLWYVMKEVAERIKWGVCRSAVPLVLLALGRVMTGVRPPLAGTLAGLRDHSIEQNYQGHRHPF